MAVRADMWSPAASSGVQLSLTPRRLAGAFALVTCALVLVHVVVQVIRFTSGDDRLYGIVFMVSLGAEDNLPTFYSAFALLSCAGMLAMIAARSATERVYWWLLALAFSFLALDEALEIHERLIEPLRHRIGAHGAFHYAWIIPYGIATVLFALGYVRFLIRLPRRTALLFVLAGTIYVGGAVGLEMIGGVLADEGRSGTPLYVLAQTIEETFEMGGVVLFIYALADYAARQLGGLAIRLLPEIAKRREAPAPRARRSP